MPKKYVVNLTDEERETLQNLLRGGRERVRRITRARVLLLADQGHTDEQIHAALGCHRTTVEHIRKRFVEGNLERALNEDRRPGGRPKLDGKQTAILIALACSEPPEGRECWTMQLLADRLVTLSVIPSISDETVRRTLQKGGSSRG